MPPSTPPEDDPTGEHAAVDDQYGDIRADQRRLLARLASVRVAASRTPGEDIAGLTDAELARQLVYDTIETLTRAEIILQTSSDIVAQLLQAQLEGNRLKSKELQLKEREVRLKEIADTREQARIDAAFGAINNRVSSLFSWVGAIAFDQRVLGAVIGAVTLVIGAFATAYISGWTLGPPQTTPPQQPVVIPTPAAEHRDPALEPIP